MNMFGVPKYTVNSAPTEPHLSCGSIPSASWLNFLVVCQIIFHNCQSDSLAFVIEPHSLALPVHTHWTMMFKLVNAQYHVIAP
jgi:hypothetical protein